ncbi:BCCT family transporter [Parapedobacter sp. ISTM3]|uniref:Choline/glycine/proline betaine transport protein n=1 Tax=Parapedobacter luteus TaxID=623280 RepID=A0A1T5BTZ6_9SPHI|nr:MULTISPECIES: BCCT family transporter [Parapedobacter]MBK1439989.1 BCCT family transporter [Parapedobacter sp. ISTM3]SKB50646.1 choline/glycine/proline betaine transport protein [Parapedobacter luteus]
MGIAQRIIQKSTLKKGIVVPSLAFILSVSFISSFFPKRAAALLNQIQGFIFTNLNWVYIWAVTLFVFFLFFLVVSRYGSIKLGDNDATPEYSFFSWVSMLFAAGMGIGLMYFSVAEPISHFSDQVFGQHNEIQRAKDAQLYTFFHWGIHAWAIYGVVGLSLSYFAYRYKLPLSLRSCFYPLLKDKINSPAGDLIDTFALCSTFFGITTTLGFGVVQLNAGLVQVGVMDGYGFGYQVVIVAVIMGISITSATTGVNKGVKFLSQVNIVAAIALMLFILALGPTVFLLGSFSEGLGHYINEFFNLTFNTHAYEPNLHPWFFSWTILYWAWWISWSPYVGLFIARISRGRTIREFIGAVLIIPTAFNFFWMTVFGNSATWLDSYQLGGLLSSMADQTDRLLFEFLNFFPATGATSTLAIFIIFIFFVTSADSGIFVMNSIATKNAAKSPKWQLAFWGILLAVLALVLLNAGGLGSLQTMTLLTALPFSFIMLLFCYSLMQGLTVDVNYYEKEFSPATVTWSGVHWKERLQRILSFKDRKAVVNFLQHTVEPALHELAAAFNAQGVSANVAAADDYMWVELTIQHERIDNFKYGVRCEKKDISDFLVSEENIPDLDQNRTYIPQSYFGDNRVGYNIEYFMREEVIADVLKQYERFLELSSQVKNEIFTATNLKRRNE